MRRVKKKNLKLYAIELAVLVAVYLGFAAFGIRLAVVPVAIVMGAILLVVTALKKDDE